MKRIINSQLWFGHLRTKEIKESNLEACHTITQSIQNSTVLESLILYLYIALSMGVYICGHSSHSIISWTSWLNPFLSVHIPYVQSEGIWPQIRLLQWRAYIFRNTQCFSTKLGRNMVNALFCHKTLKYWWPLTYIQGHVIQDGCQIQSEKSILGQKIAITRPLFWQIL